MILENSGAATVAAGDGLIKDTTTQAFMKDVIEESKHQPVLVDFWAPWCGPCRTVAPHLEALGKKHSGKLIIAKINVDEHKQTAGTLGVQSIPTLAVWSGGQLKIKEAGARTGPALEAFVAPYLR